MDKGFREPQGDGEGERNMDRLSSIWGSSTHHGKAESEILTTHALTSRAGSALWTVHFPNTITGMNNGKELELWGLPTNLFMDKAIFIIDTPSAGEGVDGKEEDDALLCYLNGWIYRGQGALCRHRDWWKVPMRTTTKRMEYLKVDCKLV